jgi:hypothetical protein
LPGARPAAFCTVAPNRRVAGRGGQQFAVEECAGYRAVQEAEDARAFGVPTAVLVKLLVFGYERRVLVEPHIVIDGGNIGLKPAAKVQAWCIKVAHAGRLLFGLLGTMKYTSKLAAALAALTCVNVAEFKSIYRRGWV